MKSFKENVNEYENKLKCEGINLFIDDLSKSPFFGRLIFGIYITFLPKRTKKLLQEEFK